MSAVAAVARNAAPKVLLVYPGGKLSGFAFPLGLLHVAGALLNKKLDVSLVHLSVDDKNSIKKENYLFVGISVLTGAAITDGLSVARIIKEYDPSIPVVLGGVHPSLLPEESLRCPLVDIVVVGEGEETVAELADCLAAGGDLSSVKGIAYKDRAGLIKVNPPREFIDLNTLDFDLPYYLLGKNIKHAYELPAHTSRGCPYRCAFCYSPAFNKRKRRVKDAQRVANEIEFLHKKYGVTSFDFGYEDEFFVEIGRVRKILELIVEKGLKIRWSSFCRFNTFDNIMKKEGPEFLGLVKKSGCAYISFGAESGSQRLLDEVIKKDIKVEQIYRTVGWMKKYAIPHRVSFMGCFPTETQADMDATFAVIDEISRDNPFLIIGYFLMSPLPGTAIFESLKEKLPAGAFPSSLEGWGAYNVPLKSYKEVAWLPAQYAKKCGAFARVCGYAFHEDFKSYAEYKKFIGTADAATVYPSGVAAYIITKIQRWRYKNRIFGFMAEVRLFNLFLRIKSALKRYIVNRILKKYLSAGAYRSVRAFFTDTRRPCAASSVGNRALVAVMALTTFAATLLGIGWGLPNKTRSALVLDEKSRTSGFYAELAAARSDIYAKAGPNPSAYAGKMSGERKTYDEGVTRTTPKRSDGTVELVTRGLRPPKEILHAMNSYLLRTWHPHEQEILNAIAKMNPRKLDFNPHFFRYGGSYLYPMAGLYWLAGKTGYLKISSDLTFYHDNPDEMAKFYLIGRLVAGVCVSLFVVLIYMTAKNFYGPRAGVIAAVFAAAAPAAYVYGVALRPHTYAALWSLCFIYFISKMHSSGERKYIWRAGISLGLAAGAVVNTWVYIVLLPAVVFSDVLRRGSSVLTAASAAVRQTLKVLAISAAVFFVVNPYVAVSPREFFDELRWASSYRRLDAKPWLFLTESLPDGMGILLWALSAAGVVYAAAKREKSDKILLSFVAALTAYVVFFIGPALRTGRADVLYHLPLMLVFLIFPARMLAAVVPVAGGRVKLIVVAVAFAAVCHAAILRSGYALWFMRDDAARSENMKAGRWINENIPRGSTIGILKYAPHTDSVPPFRFADYKIIADFETLKSVDAAVSLPEYFIVAENPDLEETKKKFSWEIFERRYELVKRFKDEIKIWRFPLENRFGFGNMPSAVYRLKRNPGAAPVRRVSACNGGRCA